MGVMHRFRFATGVQAIECKLADRFQHPEPWLVTVPTVRRQQTLIEQPGHGLDHRAVAGGLADGLRRLQRSPTREDSQAPEQDLLPRR